MTRIAIYLIIGLVATYLAALVGLAVFQRKLEYFPYQPDLPPAEAGLAEATVRRLTASDGETIVSWFVRRPGAYLAIYLHGNGSALSGARERFEDLTEFGFSVLAIDYRGYGGSSGQPTEVGLHRDADAAYAEALRLGFAADHIILLGESLGSGVALELASRQQVGGLILDSPFSSIADVAADRYWMFPVRRLLIDQYRSDLWMPKVHVPVLILHGTADRIVPFKFGRRLAALGGANVTFVPIAGAGHVVFADDAAEAPIRQWLKQFGV